MQIIRTAFILFFLTAIYLYVDIANKATQMLD